MVYFGAGGSFGDDCGFDDVNGDIPEVEKANNVKEGKQDNTQHHQADPQVGQENKGDDENTENS